MRMPSNMTHRFSEVPQAVIPRSVFDRSYKYMTTFEGGDLIPFMAEDVIPGDTFNVDATMFARLNTPLYPTMDNLYMSVFFFFVPNRLLWTNFKKQMGEQVDPGDSIAYTTPVQDAPATTGWTTGSLHDYFGIPIGDINEKEINTLPFRAYNFIWNEWFRDQDIDDSVVVDVDDGPDDESDYVLLKSRKKHDYFTSCRPWQQKGTAVSLPLGDNAPITGLGGFNQTYATSNQDIYETDKSATVVYPEWKETSSGASTNQLFVLEDADNQGYPDIRADLSSATGSTLAELRENVATQQFLERDARGGTRYAELVKSHFNVTMPDVLYRPEYLGGSTGPFIITPVPNTSEDASNKMGHLAGYGTCVLQNAGFVKSFVEHGWVIGLMCVRAQVSYQQGLHRKWSRSTRYDYYWPEFANIAEQSVLTQELYCDGSATDDDVFGYQERYGEYKYANSLITGLLRSTASSDVDEWHYAEEFGSAPTLNTTFIGDKTETVVDRASAVSSEPNFTLDSFIRCQAARPMPLYSVPGLFRL